MPLMTCPKCSRFHYVPGECLAPKLPEALVSKPRKGMSMPGKGASRTVPQASHADNRVEVTARMSDQAGPVGGRHQQPALRTEVALGSGKPKDTRKADRHPPGYQAAKQKLYRERKKAKT